MIASAPQYVTDEKGKKLSVILPVREYERMIEILEDMDDVRLYDEAKKEESEYILFSDYLKSRKKNA